MITLPYGYFMGYNTMYNRRIVYYCLPRWQLHIDSWLRLNIAYQSVMFREKNLILQSGPGAVFE